MLGGIGATGGQFFITAAYRHAPAKEIAVFDYAQVLFAAVLGYFFLSQIPDALSFIGYAVIICAAVGRCIYQLKRKKTEPAPIPPAARTETENVQTDKVSQKNDDESG